MMAHVEGLCPRIQMSDSLHHLENDAFSSCLYAVLKHLLAHWIA